MKKFCLNSAKLLVFFILIAGCSSSEKNNVLLETNDIEVYQTGLLYLQKGNYDKAKTEFDKISLNYPFSSFHSIFYNILISLILSLLYHHS